jgi:hypothetical protein
MDTVYGYMGMGRLNGDQIWSKNRARLRLESNNTGHGGQEACRIVGGAMSMVARETIKHASTASRASIARATV